MNVCRKLMTVLLVALLSVASYAKAEDDSTARSHLLEEIRGWVASQSGVPVARVEIAPMDGRLRIQTCTGKPSLDFPFANRDVVRARCEKPVWQVFIRVTVRSPRNLIYAARPLTAGQVLESADLLVRPGDLPSGEGIEDRNQVVGRILGRDLGANTLIQARDLEDAQRVIRMLSSVEANGVLAPGAFRVETLPRQRAPAGAAPGVSPGEGARAARDLPAGHILLTGDLLDTRRVLVARQNLAAGRTLEPNLFELGLVSASDGGQKYFTKFEGLESSELTRSLAAGEPLRASDLRPALLVLRGQLVLLTVSAGGENGVQISVRAEALQDGRMGEQIRLKNPESGRILNAIVTGKNAAKGL